MKKIIFNLLFFLLVMNIFAQEANNEVKTIDKDFALSIVLQLDGVEYQDSAIFYGFQIDDVENKMAGVLYQDDSGSVLIDYNQIDPLLFQAIKAMYFEMSKMKEEIADLKTELTNTKIEIDNSFKKVEYDIYTIKNEIKP